MGNLDILGRSTQATHIWIKQAAAELKWRDERRAYLALRAVLHALRDRLTNEEAVQLGAQLPTFIRGCYYEGWKPRTIPHRDHGKYSFLAEIQHAFSKTHDPNVDSIQIACAIFRLLHEKVSEGEINDVRSSLPHALRELWPEVPVAAKKTKAAPVRKGGRRPHESHGVEELLSAAKDGDRAVLGVPHTLDALNSNRAWEVMCTAGIRFTGFECPQCAGLFAAGTTVCSYCGSPVSFVRNMMSRIRERAAAQQIKVEILRGDAAGPLSKAGGIGAFLKTTRAAKLGLE
jgi:uncharacterized protein (DUF2267 family)